VKNSIILIVHMPSIII